MHLKKISAFFLTTSFINTLAFALTPQEKYGSIVMDQRGKMQVSKLLADLSKARQEEQSKSADPSKIKEIDDEIAFLTKKLEK